jgi:hypothetical protein
MPRLETRRPVPWYLRWKKELAGLAGFTVALAAFLHSFDDIKAFILRTLGRGDAHLELINQNAQMAKDSALFQIFVESRAAFLTIPVSERYYNVTFFMIKNPDVELKRCAIIVDGDDMNPLVSGGDIGDVPAGASSRAARFRLQSRDDDPESRKMYVRCDNAVSQAVILSLK